MSIKEHIISNFKNDSIDAIKDAIDESIKEQDEVTLPGLGVFFTILWNNSDEELKNKILSVIRKGLDS